MTFIYNPLKNGYTLFYVARKRKRKTELLLGPFNEPALATQAGEAAQDLLHLVEPHTPVPTRVFTHQKIVDNPQKAPTGILNQLAINQATTLGAIKPG